MGFPKVTIDQGTLRGKTAKDYLGSQFLKFQGIPYAKRPLGDLRFKAPQPPEKWIGILNATKEGDMCYSRDPFKGNRIFGSENCLFLNVYTKQLGGERRPVLFWIHGGGFTFGSGNEELYGPDFLITEDVVIVTINYRLGLLGFISFEDPTLDVPGNAALKDQVMALKWVQKNIGKFGGDPANVTIFGQSVGGASVHLLMLSPMAKGLFHKAIAQSGCALNPWIDGTRGISVLAKAMDMEGEYERTIYNALMEMSVKEVFEIQEKIVDDTAHDIRKPFGLVIEKNSKEPFLDEEPMKLMSSGKFSQVPFMTGFTSCEGMITEFYRKPGQPGMPPLEKVMPWFLGCDENTPETPILAKKLKRFYFDDEEYSKKLAVNKYNMYTDSHFIWGILDTVKAHIRHSTAPIYLYRVSIETKLNFFKTYMKVDAPGVSHCDDTGYLFMNPFRPEIKPGSTEDISVRRFVKLWTNFAKYGNPIQLWADEYEDWQSDVLSAVSWKPVTKSNLRYLDIGKDLVQDEDPHAERINFWRNLYVESPNGKKETLEKYS